MNSVAMLQNQVKYVNKAFWRNPASAFFTFAFPLMFLVIFTSLLGHHSISVSPTRSVDLSTYYVVSMAAYAVIIGVLQQHRHGPCDPTRFGRS